MADERNMPFVSVVVPCRNEKNFIGKCIESILANDYPKDRLEILAVDGASTDGTRDVILSHAAGNPAVRLIDNPAKITPCALNLGIRSARGEVIVRMDSHADYGPDYISKCVKYLYCEGADNVGGTMITLPRENGFLHWAVVKTITSRFGVGNSTFRTGSGKPVWVDTVFGGCYRKSVFERVGYFNEKLARSQDIEFNRRLAAAGGRILYHPGIVSRYYVRSSFVEFCRDYLKNGYWSVYPIKVCDKMPVSLRHLVPLFFVSALLVSGIGAVFSYWFVFLFAGIVAAYSAAAAYFAAKIALSERDIRYFFVMPFFYFLLHLLYGLGSIAALFALLPASRKPFC